MSSEFSPKVLELLGQNNTETTKIEPVNSGLIKTPNQKDPNYWTTLQDMALSASQGVVNAIEEQGDFLDENIISLGGLEFGDQDGKLSFKDFIPKIVTPKKWKAEEYSKKRNLPIFHKPETLAGNMTEGVSRFITGFAGPAKFLKGAGLVGTSVKNYSRAFGAGAIADLTVFDPNEGRLSDMLVEFDSPVLNNAVTQYLATDENDTEMEGRLKNVLEGMFLGGSFELAARGLKGTYDSIFFAIKSFKKMKATKNLEQRSIIQKESAKIIDDAKQGKKTKRLRKFALENNKAIDVEQALKVITKSKKNAKKDSELWINKILNTKSFKSGDEVVRTIDNIVDNGFDDATKEFLENDVLANETALELALLAGRNQKEVLKSLTSEGVRAKEAAVRMLTYKSVLQKISKDYQDASAKYLNEFGEDVVNWSKKAKEELALRQQVIQETFVSLKKQIKGGAQTTQAGRIKVPAADGKSLNIEKIASIFKNFDSNPAVMAKKIRDMKPEDVINEVAKSKSSKIIEVFNSLYINSILSGTPTFIVNTLGNAYEALLKPLEVASGAALRGDLKTMRYGFSHYIGMIHNFRDTIKAVGTAVKQGDPVLDPMIRTQDNLQIVNNKAIRPISGSNLGFNGKVGTGIDWIGQVAELPVKLLMATDEIFKQINYRGRLYAGAVENTLELGFKVSSKEGKDNIDKIFKEGFDKNGMANVKENDIATKALEHARVGTFQNRLDDGRYLNIGKAVQTFLQEAPYLRFLAPFVRTPTNLWRNFEQRVPVLGAFTKPMRELWKTGGRKGRADVLGRQLFGISASLYGWHLVSSDITDSQGNVYRRVTGAGPSNYKVKKLWMANGWQAYSIAQKNDDGTITYKQYNRNDPRFYVLGILADVAENNANIDDENKQNMVAVAILSAMKSAGNKSYLRGISDGFDLAEDLTPENLAQYTGKQIANAIPYQAFVANGIPFMTKTDTELLKARTFVDEIVKKFPFIDKTKYLEPVRDLLTGEPIIKRMSSVYYSSDGYLSVTQGPLLVGRKSDVKEDPVRIELSRLKIQSVTEPPEKILKIVNLIDYKINNQTAHNYWVERIGKTTKRGITLQEKLEKTFNSTRYKRRQEGNENFDGGKEMTVKKIFQAYKQEAKEDMLEKYPKVKEAIENAQKEKYGFRKTTFDIEEKPKELLPRK